MSSPTTGTGSLAARGAAALDDEVVREASTLGGVAVQGLPGGIEILDHESPRAEEVPEHGGDVPQGVAINAVQDPRYAELAMSLLLTADPPPLTAGADGVVRVGGTRVTLDTVVEAFREGLTPEEIQQQYASLHLAHVYSAVTYYLYHRPEVEEYLRGRARHRENARREAEARLDPTGIRDRLLARVRV